MSVTLTTNELTRLGVDVFTAAGAEAAIAVEVTEALVAAELEGIGSHGFSRIPFYAAQIKSGKVNGSTKPVVSQPAPGIVHVDACNGFAFPAINAGMKKLLEQTAVQGICGLGVTRSHHCGVLGLFAEKIACAGFIGLCFANTPAAMAPWGGNKASFGTNPLAFGCPRENSPPLVIDLSLSKVARGKIMVAGKKGESIPEGWALDAEGEPTTDPKKALAGTMIPLGDAKGAALAFMVEVLAASLTGANHAYEASSFFDATGPAPGVGQFFIAIDPQKMNSAFAARFEALCHFVLQQSGTRLPGERRVAERAKRSQTGVELSDALFDELNALKG